MGICWVRGAMHLKPQLTPTPTPTMMMMTINMAMMAMIMMMMITPRIVSRGSCRITLRKTGGQETQAGDISEKFRIQNTI